MNNRGGVKLCMALHYNINHYKWIMEDLLANCRSNKFFIKATDFIDVINAKGRK